MEQLSGDGWGTGGPVADGRVGAGPLYAGAPARPAGLPALGRGRQGQPRAAVGTPAQPDLPGAYGVFKQLQGNRVRKDDTAIPAVQQPPGQPAREAVLRRAAQAYGPRVADLVQPTRRPSEARQVGIYAARRVAGGDLKTVARRFGLGYTAVSRRVGTVANRLRNDPRLRSQVEKIYKGKVKT